MVQIPPITNWSVFPQNGDIGYFDDMNVWIGQGNTVIPSANASIVKMNEAIVEINNIAENAINAITFDNIAQLKLNSNMGRVDVLGYHTKGDGGGGTFYWDSTSTDADDGGYTIQATGINQGRWKRPLANAVDIRKYGAKGDGVTNDYQSFLKASLLNKPVELADGKIYNLESQLVLNNSAFNRRGLYCNGLATIKSNTLTIPTIKIKGGSGDLPNSFKLEGIKFTGYGLEIAGAGGIIPTRCYFEGERGITLHNESLGEFTEGCVASFCRFNCKTALEYKVTNGNDSFHGSGLDNCWVNGVAGYSPIVIGSGAFVYNSPMTSAFFGVGDTTPLIQNNYVARSISIYGTIRLEGHNGNICDMGNIMLQGGVIGLDNFKFGNLAIVHSYKKTGASTGNIMHNMYAPTSFAIKTTSPNQTIDLGNDAIFYVYSNNSIFIVASSNNNGLMPLLSSVNILKGSKPTFTNNGDILQMIVPSAGVVQVFVQPIFNPNGTSNGLVLNNYKEI